MAEDKEVQEGKIYGLLAYIPLLWILTLLLKKDNKFALFHGKQGLVIFIFQMSFVLIGFIPFLGTMVLHLGFFILGLASLWGIIQALIGNYAKIPVICDIADKINL